MLLQELEDEYDKARSILKDALRAANWTATVDSTYTEYLEVLSGSSTDTAAADKLEGEGGEGAAAGAAGDGGGDTAMADADESAKGGKGDKVGGLDASLAAKVAAVRDSHKRVYFEEQVRTPHPRKGFQGGEGVTGMVFRALVHFLLLVPSLQRCAAAALGD